MMDLWIPLTIAAAFLQNVRSALQKKLKGDLGTSGATFVRFVYALPVAGLYLAGLYEMTGAPWLELTTEFLAYAASGGLAQIAGTALLVSLFDHRSFAVGTTYSKTETVQTAIFAIVVLGEAVSPVAALGILVSLAGVVAISVARRSPAFDVAGRTWLGRPAWVGLGSGAAFGVAAVCYRGASLSLGGEGFALQAATTLFFVLVFQTAVMAVYMSWRVPDQLQASFRAWPTASWVGASGALASMGWFSAMTLQNAALVRAVGQIELIFTLVSSVVFFGERILRAELIGIALVALGILILLLG